MTDLTTTPEGQSGDPMDFASNAGDIRPDPKRHRTRRRRWYLLAATPAFILTLAACGVLRQGYCHMGGVSPDYSPNVTFDLSRFDLSPVLAHAAMPVHVRACVRQRYLTLRSGLPRPTSSCFSFPVDQRGLAFTVHGLANDHDSDPSTLPFVFVEEPSLSSELPIAVRLNVSRADDSVFDSSAVVQPYKYEPNGPGCEPTIYSAVVEATRAGHLVPQTQEPNS